MKKKIKKSTENEYNRFRKYFVFSCVDVVILKNNSVLLTIRTQNPHKGSWHIPGGIIRKNETMIEAVKRAAKNELNLNVKIKKYIGAYENLNAYRHDVSHGFIVTIVSEKIKTDLQTKELKFFKKIPKNTISHHKKMIRDVLINSKKFVHN